MKIMAVSERVPYFLSKNSLQGKLKLLGSQTPGTKQLRRKKLQLTFDQIITQLSLLVLAGQNNSINQMYLDFSAKVLSLQWSSKETWFQMSNLVQLVINFAVCQARYNFRFPSSESSIFCSKNNTEVLNKEPKLDGSTCRF